MDIPSIQPIKAKRSSPPGRAVLGALLLGAFALAILVGDIQDAQAQVGIQAGYNYISNGSFETDSDGDGIPDEWFSLHPNLTPADKRVCNQSAAGSCSFRMVGDDTFAKYLVQCIPLTGTNAGNKFRFNVWTKGKTIVGTGFGYVGWVEFNNGGPTVNQKMFDIPNGTSPWTLHRVSATAKADYDEICIFLINTYSGIIWFDKLSLVYIGGP